MCVSLLLFVVVLLCLVECYYVYVCLVGGGAMLCWLWKWYVDYLCSVCCCFELCMLMILCLFSVQCCWCWFGLVFCVFVCSGVYVWCCCVVFLAVLCVCLVVLRALCGDVVLCLC